MRSASIYVQVKTFQALSNQAAMLSLMSFGSKLALRGTKISSWSVRMSYNRTLKILLFTWRNLTLGFSSSQNLTMHFELIASSSIWSICSTTDFSTIVNKPRFSRTETMGAPIIAKLFEL